MTETMSLVAILILLLLAIFAQSMGRPDWALICVILAIMPAAAALMTLAGRP